jgi:ferritin
MLSKPIQDALNEQIKHEINSAYIYLAMSAYCESINMSGCARWLKVQWQEELEHSMKLFNYVYDRGGRVSLQAIDRPQADYSSVKEVFTQVLAHEQKVTALINSLFGLAVKENDYATQVEVQWFIKEQVEEEKHAGEILDTLKIAGESGPSLIMLDRHLGSRGK